MADEHSNDDYLGVIYRKRMPTLVDYDDAIANLQAARKAIETGDESKGCAICEDGGHGVRQCHHNPLMMARAVVQERGKWRCYHCGYVATTDAQAIEHFGSSENEVARCLEEKLKCVLTTSPRS